MSKSGLRMDNFHSGHPSCSPTRGSIITGRHPNRYGTFYPGCSIRPEEISIAQIMKKAGYTSAHYGKWHLGPVKKESPTNPGAMGFDEWLSHDNFFEMNPLLSRNGGDPEQYQGEGSQVIVDEAIRFIQKVNRKQPFFIVIWYGSPHEPYSGLSEDLEIYDDLPAEFEQKTVRLTSNETGEQVERPLHEVLKERYAEITAMDRSIGVLRDFLEQNGISKNTMLWYCGDNGTPPSADRTGMTLRGQKGTMYEGGIRVPGIIEWPERIEPGSVSNVNSVTSDMLPTLCEIVGQPLPNRPLDGISLVPMINGEMKSRPSPICFWSFENNEGLNEKSEPYIEPGLQEGTLPLVKKLNGKFTRSFVNWRYPVVSENDINGPRTIIDNKYKLVIDEEATVELFDLVEDRGETNNLATSYPEIVEQMSRQLYNWQQSVLKSLSEADYK
jgi:arylsulfatase A-like enzyme